jgi:hypothetical protein
MRGLMHRFLTRSLIAGAVIVAACSGNDDDTSDETVAPATTSASSGTTAGGAAPVDLAAVCPDPLVIQTNWFPEGEHGGLYEMVGEGYTVDTDQQVVRGPLLAGGQDTGIDIELRAGGSAIGNQAVSVVQYTDDSIHLGHANTEGQLLRYDETPVLAVVAPMEINPQMIFWDPETYPDVETLADLGEQEITINIFEAGTFADVLVAEGIWNADQIDPSYDGSPARFVAEDGAIAQQGFASNEPYTYEHLEEWGRPVRFQTLHDAGFEVYAQMLAIVPDRLEELRPCLELFVPIAQQAAIDYIEAPDRANAIIIDAVEQYDTFWTYDEGLAQYAVETQRDLDIIGNGPDGTLGNFDEQRVQRVIEQISDAGLEVPDGLTFDDLVTNEFVDMNIGL